MNADRAVNADAATLCFGEALWDCPGEQPVPGGAPLNVALQLHQAGISTKLLSRVGNDPDGRDLIHFLDEQGLETQSIQLDPDQPTGRVAIDRSDPQRVQFDIPLPMPWDFISAAQFLDAPNSQFDALLFGTLAARHEVSRKSLFELLELAELRIFDPNFRPPWDDTELAIQLLSKAHWAKLNEDEYARINATLSEPLPMEAFADHFGLEVLCVTRGASGASLWYDNQLIHQGGFDVDIVDAIGCGDAFLGVLVAGLLQGEDAGSVLQRACAVGAIVAGKEGASPQIEDREILRLIAS